MRDFERLQDRSRFVTGLHVFARRHRIGHDSRARLHVGAPVFRDQRAQANAGIEIAGKIEIEDCARVDAAPSRLKLVNDFHGANFGRA